MPAFKTFRDLGFKGRVNEKKMEDIHHHVAHTILHLPFAHVSGIKAHHVVENLEKWHCDLIPPQLAAVSSTFTSSISSSLRIISLPKIPEITASIAKSTAAIVDHQLHLSHAAKQHQFLHQTTQHQKEHLPRAIFARRKNKNISTIEKNPQQTWIKKYATALFGHRRRCRRCCSLSHLTASHHLQHHHYQQ